MSSVKILHVKFYYIMRGSEPLRCLSLHIHPFSLVSVFLLGDFGSKYTLCCNYRIFQNWHLCSLCSQVCFYCRCFIWSSTIDTEHNWKYSCSQIPCPWRWSTWKDSQMPKRTLPLSLSPSRRTALMEINILLWFSLVIVIVFVIKTNCKHRIHDFWKK